MLILRLFSVVCVLISVLLLGVALICLGDPHFAKGYLADIFSAPLFYATLGVFVIFLLLRRRISAIITLAAAGVLGLSLLSQFMPPHPAITPDAKPVRVMFANLWVRNYTPERLMAWVEAEDPDIVAIIEVTQRSRDRLGKPLAKKYPYAVIRYETLIYSRYPITDGGLKWMGYSLTTARIKGPDGPLDLAVTHLTRPWPFNSPKDQPAQFNRLGNDLSKYDLSRTIVVGDFNTTPSAALMRDFSTKLDLTPAAAPVGTWPAALPSPLRVGIDNVLAGSSLSLKRRKVGPYYGSDHLPVVVDVYPAAKVATPAVEKPKL